MTTKVPEVSIRDGRALVSIKHDPERNTSDKKRTLSVFLVGFRMALQIFLDFSACLFQECNVLQFT